MQDQSHDDLTAIAVAVHGLETSVGGLQGSKVGKTWVFQTRPFLCQPSGGLPHCRGTLPVQVMHMWMSQQRLACVFDLSNVRAA